jgi:predicted acyltransferase
MSVPSDSLPQACLPQALSSPSGVSQRSLTLDAFRGVAIAGMILVNMASLGTPYPWLAHADWHGFTLADWVFPGFLFGVGASLAYGKPKSWGVILRRTLILFGLGLLLNGFWQYDLATLRWLGVLQRIALTYFLASGLIRLPRALQVAGVTLLLLAISHIITWPVSTEGEALGLLSRTGTFTAWIDRLVIPAAHLYRGDGFNQMADPEGLMGSLTALGNVMVGYWAGLWTRRMAPQPSPLPHTVTRLLVALGFVCLLLGALWDPTLAINKKLWTSSFVLFSSGWSLLLWASLLELSQRRSPTLLQPLAWLGRNAIALFVLSVLLIKLLVKLQVAGTTPYGWLSVALQQTGLSAQLSSLAIALVTLGGWWLVARVWDRRGWFWKI